MARGHILTRRHLAALALCLVAAVAGHTLVLAWWEGRPTSAGASLRRLPDPIFTRLLAPDPPAPAPKSAPAPVRASVKATPGALALATPVNETRTAPETPAAPPAAAASAPALADPPAEAAPNPPATAVAALDAASEPVAPAAATDSWPPDARLTYKLEGRWRSGPLYGSARVQWQRQGVHYQAQVEVDIPPFAHRALTSQGEVTPRGLVPRAYEERSRTRARTLRMGDAQIVLHDGRAVPRPEEVQDTASQFVELGYRFATGRQTLALGEVVTVWLARPGGVEQWTYDVIAQDLVVIPRLGEVVAWRLRPRAMPQRRDQISAEIWFAPSLRHLPVRIRLALGDEAEIDLKVEMIEQR